MPALMVVPGISFPYPASRTRRLPIAVAPGAGESLPSWVERLAAHLGIPVGFAVKALGLPVREHRGPLQPVLYGIAPTPTARAALADSAGLADGEVEGMYLSRFDGTALDLSGLGTENGGGERGVTGLVGREWALFHARRACPRCLAIDGLWRTWWSLGAAAVCPQHRLLLVDACPGCGIALRRGSAGAPGGLSVKTVTDPRVCGNLAAPRHLCAFPLAELPQIPVSGELVQAQRTVLTAAFGRSAALAGHQVSSRRWFKALIAVTALIRFAAAEGAITVAELPEVSITEFAAEEAERRGRPTCAVKFRTMPATAALAAALLAAATPVLRAADEDAAAALLAPWARAAADRRLHRHHNPLRTVEIPAPLDRILASVTPSARRLVGVQHRARSPRPSFGTHHVPQILREVEYRDLVADCLPGISARSGRRLAALALARLAGAGTWAAAGEALELDPMASRKLANRAVQKVADPDRFWSAIRTVAARMDEQPNPPDYAARRRALAGLDDVPHAILAAPLQRIRAVNTAARKQAVNTAARRRAGAVWVWCEFTGGDYHDAPAIRATPNATLASQLLFYQRFTAWAPQPVTSALTAYGHHLLDLPGTP